MVQEKANAKLNVKNLKPTVKHMDIYSFSVVELVFIEGTMNEYMYLNILQNNVHI